MISYNSLISSEKNSLAEIKLNHLVKADNIEKICVCSAVASMESSIEDLYAKFIAASDLDVVEDGGGSLFVSDKTVIPRKHSVAIRRFLTGIRNVSVVMGRSLSDYSQTIEGPATEFPIDVIEGESFMQTLSGFDFDSADQIIVVMYKAMFPGYSLSWVKTPSVDYPDAGPITKNNLNQIVFNVNTDGLSSGSYDIEATVYLDGVMPQVIKQRSRFIKIIKSRI